MQKRLEAHLTLVVLEDGRVTQVEHVHLAGNAADRVRAGFPPGGCRGTGVGGANGTSGTSPTSGTSATSGFDSRSSLTGRGGAAGLVGNGGSPNRAGRLFGLRGRCAFVESPAGGWMPPRWLIGTCLFLSLLCLTAAYLIWREGA